MSYSDKLSHARALLEIHYCAVSVPMPDDAAKDVIAKIRTMGGTSEAALRMLLPSDLMGHGVPSLVARQIAAEFGAVDDSEDESRSRPPEAAAVYASVDAHPDSAVTVTFTIEPKERSVD